MNPEPTRLEAFTDDVLTRMLLSRPDERDAIIRRELAHVPTQEREPQLRHLALALAVLFDHATEAANAREKWLAHFLAHTVQGTALLVDGVHATTTTTPYSDIPQPKSVEHAPKNIYEWAKVPGSPSVHAIIDEMDAGSATFHLRAALLLLNLALVIGGEDISNAIASALPQDHD